MNSKKITPVLLLTFVLSLTLFGCTDRATNTTGANNTSNPATSSASGNPSPSNSTVSNPTAATSDTSGNANANANSSSTALKMTVVKYSFVSTGLVNYYIGVVRNDGSNSVKQVIMHLVDDSGRVISTDDAPETMLPQVFDLPPGQSVGFSMMYEGSPIKHPTFSFEQQPDDTNLADAKLTVVSSQQGTASDGNPNIEGDIRNDSATSANLWSLNAVAYDDAGNVVAVGSGAAADPAQPLKGHSTIKFSVTLSPGNVKIAKYELFASGVTMGLN